MAASTLASQRVFAENAIVTSIVTPASAVSAYAAAVDMKDAVSVGVTLTRAVGTTVLSAFRLDVCAALSGGIPLSNTTAKVHALGSNVDAVGDTVCLELTSEEARNVLSTARYVIPYCIDTTGAATEAIVTIAKLRNAGLDKTADVIA